MTNVAPEFALFDPPLGPRFLVQDREHLKAIDAEIVQTALAPKAEDAGLKVLSRTWGENGFTPRHQQRPPESTCPADLDGLKDPDTPLRSGASRCSRKWGANPTPIGVLRGVFVVRSRPARMDGQGGKTRLTNIHRRQFPRK